MRARLDGYSRRRLQNSCALDQKTMRREQGASFSIDADDCLLGDGSNGVSVDE